MKRKTTPRHYTEEQYDKKRRVLSYEQLPLDEYEQQEEQSKKPKLSLSNLSYKRIFIAMVLIVLLVSVVFIVFSRFVFPSCSGGLSASTQFPVTLKGSLISNGNFQSYDSGISYVSDTNYVVYSKTGEEKLVAQVAYNQPVLSLNYNGSAVVYDLGGNKYSLFSDTELVYSGECENTMYLADVTPDFAYGYVTENRDYKAKLSVFDKEHKPLFGYSFEEYYITSMHINNDATGAVVCGITAENGVEKSSVYIFDFTEEKPVAFHEFKGETLYDCAYLSNSAVCLVGEGASYVLNGWGFDTLHKNSYNQMELTSYDINTDIGSLAVSLSRSGDGRNCTIQYIDDSGKVENTIETSLSANFISTYKNRVAICDTSKVYLYTISGDFLSEESVSKDSRQIRLLSPDSCAVLGIKDISYTTFK